MAFSKVVANATRPLLWVKLSLKERYIPAIVDTGAQFSCIRTDVIEYLVLTGEPHSLRPCQVNCVLADGTTACVSNAVKLHVGLMSFSWDYEFKVLNAGPFPAILGLDFLRHTGMTIDLPNSSFRFAFAPNDVGSFLTKASEESEEPFLQELCGQVVELNTIAQLRPKELRAETLREEYPRLFTSTLDTASCTPYNIELSDDTPVRFPPYRCAPQNWKNLRT